MKQLLKFLSLPPNDRFTLIKAFILLITIRMMLYFLPFSLWRYLLISREHLPAKMWEKDQAFVSRVVWAVKVASRLNPGVKCLAQAMATKVLLVHHGCPAYLRIGIAKSEDEKLEAHAWVESEGKVLIGSIRDLSGYTPLLSLNGVKL